MRNYSLLIITSALTALSVVSCMAATPVAVQQISSEVSPTASSLPSQPVPTRTAQATPTRPAPSTPSAMPATVTPPTGTPPPTLTPVEGAKLVKELLATNSDCELPGWWGIHPGEPLSDANVSLFLSAPYHDNYDISDTRVGLAFEYTKNRSSAGLDYNVDVTAILTAGVVSQVVVGSSVLDAGTSAQFAQDWQALALHRVLTKFGMPSEVRLSANEYIPEEGAPFLFRLNVIYADKGIAIQYHGYLQRRAGKLMLCPALSHVNEINLLLTSPGNGAQFYDYLREWPQMSIEYTSPIQDNSTLSLTDFYSMFRDSPNACFNPFKPH